MVVTLPALMLAIMPIFYPKLVSIMRKRSVLIIAAILFLVRGVGPAIFNDNIYVILLFRFLMGMACGTFMPMSTDLIADFFESPERRTMVGLQSAFTGLSGVMFQTLGGYLAAIHWSYCFLAYLVSIVLLLMPIIFLPEPPRAERLAKEQEITGTTKSKIPGSVWLVGFFLLLFWLFTYIIITNAAPVLIIEGIASQGKIGLIFDFMTIGTVLSSALFGKLLGKFGFVILPIALLLSGVAMFIFHSAHSIPGFMLRMFIIGFSGGIIVPTVMERNVSLVPYSGGTKAIAISFLNLGIGSFISPLVFNNTGLDARSQMQLASIAFLIIGIIAFFVIRAVKPHDDALKVQKQEEKPQETTTE